MTRAQRHRVALTAGLAAALVAALASGGPSSAAGTKTIRVEDDAFSPKRITIDRDTLVTWRWSGDNAHDVVSRGTKRFKRSALKSSGVHRYRFTRPGTYRYVCTLHETEGMTGRIIVR